MSIGNMSHCELLPSPEVSGGRLGLVNLCHRVGQYVLIDKEEVCIFAHGVIAVH